MQAFFSPVSSPSLLSSLLSRCPPESPALPLLVHGAALSGCDRVLEAVLRVDPEPGRLASAQDATGCTPLHLSVFAGQLRATKMLLQAGADRNKR